jgi:hypothetical protein
MNNSCAWSNAGQARATRPRGRLAFLNKAWIFLVSLVLAGGAIAAEESSGEFISHRIFGDHVVLEWTGPGSLQSADTVIGPWETVPNAASPFSANRSGGFRFYRLVDTDGPAVVSSITALDDTTVRVTFDRPMGMSAINPFNYSVSSDDGEPVEVVGANFKALNVVDLTTTPQSYASYDLTVNNIQDSVGQPVYFDGRNFSGNPKGAVVSAGAPSSTRVIVVFNEPMADNALAPQHYSIKDSTGTTLEVADANFDGPLTMVVELTTAPQANLLYTLTATNITDLGGDPLAGTTRTATFQGVAAVGLSQAVPTDSTHVTLTFTGPVGDTALAPSTFLIEQLDIANNVVGALSITSARFLGDQKTIVELTTKPQQNARYRISTTAALTDPAGNLLPAASIPFDGIGGQPEIALVVSTGPTSCLITFSVPMSDDVLSPAAYGIAQLDDATKTVRVVSAAFVGSERRVVELTTTLQGSVLYNLTVNDIVDVGGNPFGETRTATFQGGIAARLSRAVPTDSTHLILTFTGPIGDTALAPSSYLIEQLDAGDNVIGLLGMTSAHFVGDQKTIVDLTTRPQQSVRYRISTTTALTDRGGNVLPGASILFDGITGQPSISLVASTGPTSCLITFNVPMSDDVLSSAAYEISQLDDQTKTLQVLRTAFVGSERRVVELTTAPQQSVNYVIRGLEVSNVSGTPLVLPIAPGANLFTGNGSPSGTPAETAAPRVVGAASLNNTNIIVAFSEPMSASAIQAEHYVIVQENVNPEAAYLRVSSAVFYNQNPSTVLLTTSSQNELTYRVTVVNATDLSGTALAPKVISNGVLVDPTSALFPGTPPVGGVDSDGDGLSDNVEMRGWIVTIHNADGTVSSRGVTSDPAVEDTDGDELNDAQEANLRFDPRSADSDDDQINDYAEFNEVYTNGLDQDTDHDGLDDFLEFAFFHTSPLFADTDGDQISDPDEIIGNRNARVSDLPRPEISVGAVNLQLDVKFTETSAQERRDLETRAVTSTLTASERQTFTRQDTVNVEAHFDIGTSDGTDKPYLYARGGFSAGYTFQQTAESESQTQKSYERSLSTDKEVTKGFTVERDIQGAVMQVTVNLRNISSLAYRVKNLQITAFIQDPQDHTRLTPIATLLPDSEPEDGFTLGPLAAERGPFIFSNTTIVPTLVETLMANSSGLIFRISNYDIIDERGRNFAFSSQEIVERTARLVIDFGGASSLRALVSGEAFDEIQPGDETEIHRVATSAGRAIDDTNEDGRIDRYPREIFDADGDVLDADYPVDYNGDGLANAADDTYEGDTIVVFDAAGKPVGIGLHQAMAAVGLVRYDELTTPTTNLVDEEILTSYSTVVVGGREKIFRIRGISNDSLNRKFWEILTPLGVDQITDLNDLILKPNSPVSLNFVQDLDLDGLTADVEFFLRTSDSDTIITNSLGQLAPRGRDTDDDTLDDRFEALIGWTVTTPLRTYKVWPSPNRKDSNFDDPENDPLDLYDGSDSFAAPGRWLDVNSNNLRDPFNEVFQVDTNDYVLDPIRKDTDGDGINDADEVVGFFITRITDTNQVFFRGPHPDTGLRPNPLHHDTDGDTFSDGFERLVGLDPTDPIDVDTDGDGLPDPVEDDGWDVTTIGLSTNGFLQGLPTTNLRRSNTNSVDSDLDGLTDFEEFFLKTNPNAADTDGDGIKDVIELLGYSLPHKVADEDLGIITTLMLDADTDNDKRSDGAEAELVDVELDRWVVRVDGQTPIRVFSNPLVADADFDSVVDGDEFAFDPLNPKRHTDPNNGNTDGDGRDDGVEIAAGTNPLAVDVRVTVIAQSVETSAPGQFNFALNVRPPDPAGVGGLSPTPREVFASDSGNSRNVGFVKHDQNGVYCAGVYYRWFDTIAGEWKETASEGDLCVNNSRTSDPGLKGVRAGATFEVKLSICCVGASLHVEPNQQFVYTPGSLAVAKFQSSDIVTSADFDYRGIETPVPNPEDFPLSERSRQFGLAAGERFSIEATVTGITTTATETIKLGGLEGAKAFQESSSETPTQIRPVFSLAEVQDKFLEEFYFEGTVNGVTVKITFFYLIE